MLGLQETIRPSADLRNHYSEIPKQKSRIELLKILAEAEDDVKNGRVAPISDTFHDLRAVEYKR